MPPRVTIRREASKFPERARERFLTSEELARLGDALRLAGLPWRIDETKENAKHAPKEDNRRVVLGWAALHVSEAVYALPARTVSTFLVVR